MKLGRPEPELLQKLKSIAKFLPIFEDPDFQFGEWIHSEGQLPFFNLSAPADEFEQMAYHAGWVGPFSWVDWQNTDEARRLLNDRDFLAEADVKQLERLLTTLVRKDRFSEGLLADAYKSGLLTSIIRRAAAILASFER